MDILFSWCHKVIYIRTLAKGICCIFDFIKGDCLRTLLVVKCYNKFIVIKIDRIDKSINQSLAMFHIHHIQITEVFVFGESAVRCFA